MCVCRIRFCAMPFRRSAPNSILCGSCTPQKVYFTRESLMLSSSTFTAAPPETHCTSSLNGQLMANMALALRTCSQCAWCPNVCSDNPAAICFVSAQAEPVEFCCFRLDVCFSKICLDVCQRSPHPRKRKTNDCPWRSHAIVPCLIS